MSDFVPETYTDMAAITEAMILGLVDQSAPELASAPKLFRPFLCVAMMQGPAEREAFIMPWQAIAQFVGQVQAWSQSEGARFNAKFGRAIHAAYVQAMEDTPAVKKAMRRDVEG